MNKQTIYISAYPKSGSTYLTRLLGDVLNSPTGGCMPSQDVKEIATEGLDRPGPYIVRKGHFVLIDDDIGPVVPSPHRMAWKLLTNEKIVFLIRDPRDICISGAYHWHTTPAEFLDRMIKGDVAKCGRWDKYVDESLEILRAYLGFTPIFYEQLLKDCSYQIEGILSNFDIKEELNITEAIERQSFANRAVGLNEQELRLNNMRKGIAGDWRNHFSYRREKEFNDKIWNEFGWIMERLGYDKDLRSN